MTGERLMVTSRSAYDQLAPNQAGEAVLPRMFSHPAAQAGPLPVRHPNAGRMAMALPQLWIFRRNR